VIDNLTATIVCIKILQRVVPHNQALRVDGPRMPILDRSLNGRDPELEYGFVGGLKVSKSVKSANFSGDVQIEMQGSSKTSMKTPHHFLYFSTF